MAFKVTVGQYYHASSFLHKLDPRVKIFIMTLFMVLIFFADNFLTNLLIFVVLSVLVYISKVPVRLVWKSLKPIMGFLLIAGLMNLFFVKTGDELFRFAFISINSGGLRAFFIYTLRFFYLVLAGSLLTFTTNPIQLTDAFEALLMPFSKLGLPIHEISMMLSIALRFIPTLSNEAEHIIKAQTSRGADFEGSNFIERVKLFIPIIVPLFASAFRHADNLAIAMDARCYVGGEGRTHYRVLQTTKHDFIFIALFAVFLLSFILLKLFGL
ncbi:MAG: energy-coupling factor transporter transmembrane component T [Coriobacteriia bacterium]|nr:energy-coupling factor transporter transmembrane component T [Coriobacteriia bacterium]